MFHLFFVRAWKSLAVVTLFSPPAAHNNLQPTFHKFTFTIKNPPMNNTIYGTHKYAHCTRNCSDLG